MSRHSKPKTVSLERAYCVLRRPLVTEKVTLASAHGTFGFEASNDATKHDIKSAVEQIFGVTVLSVNTLIQKGKSKRFRGREGRRSDMKKAFVRLKQGETIDVGARF